MFYVKLGEPQENLRGEPLAFSNIIYLSIFMEKMERRKRKKKRFCHFSAISSREVLVLKKRG
jgi:hypothetical protein